MWGVPKYVVEHVAVCSSCLSYMLLYLLVMFSVCIIISYVISLIMCFVLVIFGEVLRIVGRVAHGDPAAHAVAD